LFARLRTVDFVAVAVAAAVLWTLWHYSNVFLSLIPTFEEASQGLKSSVSVKSGVGNLCVFIVCVIVTIGLGLIQSIDRTGSVRSATVKGAMFGAVGFVVTVASASAENPVYGIARGLVLLLGTILTAWLLYHMRNNGLTRSRRFGPRRNET
jgi:putative effector of murein hydrolase